MRATVNFNNKNISVLYAPKFFSSFAYYGLLSLLMLFFIHTLKLSQVESYVLIGSFVGVSMIAALVSGFISSQYLSSSLCCLLGFVGYLIGSFLLIKYQDMFYVYLGLSFVAGGYGLFEPNAQILFGAGFHESSHSKRNIGFIILYLFNIIGQFFGPIVLTYLNIIDPRYLFIGTGLSSLVGLIYIACNFRKMRALEFSQDQLINVKKHSFFRTCVAAFLLVILIYVPVQSVSTGFFSSFNAMIILPFVVAIFWMVRKFLRFDKDVEMPVAFEKNKNIVFGTLAVGMLFVLSFFTISGSQVKSLFVMLFIPIAIFLAVTLWREKNEVRHGIISLFLLFVATLFSEVCLRVCFGIIDIFTKNFVDRNLLGWHIDTAIFESAEPFFILLFFVGVIWAIKYFSNRQNPLSYGALMSFGLLMFSACFASLVAGISLAQGSAISMGWLLLCYLLMAIGELCTIPIAFSAVTGLSPRNWQGGVMGILYMTGGLGAYFSSEIGKFITPIVGIPTLETYQNLFFHWMSYTALSALLLYFVWNWLNKGSASAI